MDYSVVRASGFVSEIADLHERAPALAKRAEDRSEPRHEPLQHPESRDAQRVSNPMRLLLSR